MEHATWWRYLLEHRLRLALGVFFVIAFVALLLEQAILVGDFRVDDAYISFSYAKNLASGHGLVFSEDIRVEGYSNFLWVLLTALGYVFIGTSDDPYPVVRAFAFVFLLTAGLLTYKLSRRKAGSFVSLCAVLLLFSSTDLFRATASGLETVPYVTAVLFGWWAYCCELDGQRRWSMLAFIPAALMRIDGFVPAFVVLGFESAYSLMAGRFSARSWLRWWVPAVLVWGAYFVWRWLYYGLPLPTTYYAKTLVSLGDPLRGFRQGYVFLSEYGLIALAPWILVAAMWGPRRQVAALLVGLLANFAYVGKVGGDWMPFQRFFLPALPLFAVLMAWGVQAAYQKASEVGAKVTWLTATLALGCALWTGTHANAGVVSTSFERDKLALAVHVKNHTLNNLLASVPLMRWVPRRAGDKLVTDYAGVFSVFTDAAIIDMWGLCQKDIALRGGARGINPIYGKECAECYADIEPDYFHVVVPIVRGPEAYHSIEEIVRDIFQGPAIDRVIDLKRNYVVGRVVDDEEQKALWFLEKRRLGLDLVSREPAPGISIDYPFERERAAGDT
jgi:hypothetical protein